MWCVVYGKDMIKWEAGSIIIQAYDPSAWGEYSFSDNKATFVAVKTTDDPVPA